MTNNKHEAECTGVEITVDWWDGESFIEDAEVCWTVKDGEHPEW